MEYIIVSKEVLIKGKYNSLYVYDEPVSYTLGSEGFFPPGPLNLKEKQITKLTYTKYYNVRNEKVWNLR